VYRLYDFFLGTVYNNCPIVLSTLYAPIHLFNHALLSTLSLPHLIFPCSFVPHLHTITRRSLSVTAVFFCMYNVCVPFSIFKFRIVRRRVRRRRSVKRHHSSYLLHKHTAHELVRARLEYFNTFYNFSYKKITIRNQASRWGSCSRRGNINFNYRIALISPELADYVIVHELCHLGEFNHSQKFWDLVERTIPNWKSLRKRLQDEGKKLF
jgi:hypothetical protein